jgi:hypothetical protein
MDLRDELISHDRAGDATGRVERFDFFRRGHVSCSDLSVPDNRHTSNGGVLERIAKGVSTDHSSCGNDYKTGMALYGRG